jgi:hypothetical protein
VQSHYLLAIIKRRCTISALFARDVLVARTLFTQVVACRLCAGCVCHHSFTSSCRATGLGIARISRVARARASFAWCRAVRVVAESRAVVRVVSHVSRALFHTWWRADSRVIRVGRARCFVCRSMLCRVYARVGCMMSCCFLYRKFASCRISRVNQITYLF